MDHYRLYSPEQFALDKYFQEWVLAPNNTSNHDWKLFIEQHPYKKAAIDEAAEMVRLSGLSLDESANAAYLEGWNRIQENAVKGRTRYAMVSKVAAAAAALLVIAFAAYRFQTKSNQTVLFTTGYGEIKKFTLEDGTAITLNANSTLQIDNEKFTADSRAVTIDGNAFFEVVHTANNAPFTVHAGEVEVHVLGTSFNVNSHHNDVRVYLRTGKIKMVSGNEEQLLSPGDQAFIASNDKTIKVEKLAGEIANNNLAWLKNQYVMNDIALSQVADDIEQIFGKVVVAEDTSLLSKRVTAKVPANDLKVLVEVLSQALEIKVEEKDNHLYLRRAEMR